MNKSKSLVCKLTVHSYEEEVFLWEKTFNSQSGPQLTLNTHVLCRWWPGGGGCQEGGVCMAGGVTPAHRESQDM